MRLSSPRSHPLSVPLARPPGPLAHPSDDGPGFAGSVLLRVGAPWNTSRQGKSAHRGLGIFIASTLIESLGGSILYDNGAEGGGEVNLLLPMKLFD